MSIAYINQVRSLLEKINPDITNIDIFQIIYKNSNYSLFVDLIDREMIDLVELEWFFDNCTIIPEFLLKLIEYCNDEELSIISKWIHSYWVKPITIAEYKKVRQALPNLFPVYDRYDVLLVEYNNQTRILTFAEKSYTSMLYGHLSCDIDDLSFHILGHNISIKKNIYETCNLDIGNDFVSFERDGYKIYRKQKMTLEELLTYV